MAEPPLPMVRVLPWEGFDWGVDIDHCDGKRHAYAIRAQEAAEAEAQRIRSRDRADARRCASAHKEIRCIAALRTAANATPRNSANSPSFLMS